MSSETHTMFTHEGDEHEDNDQKENLESVFYIIGYYCD